MPTLSKRASAAVRSAAVAASFPHTAVAPAPTRAGVFGIARMIRAPAGSAVAIRAIGVPAAMEIHSGRASSDAVASAASPARTPATTFGFTASTTISQLRTISALFAHGVTPRRSAKFAQRAGSTSATRTEDAETPAATSPPARASAIAPAPTNPIVFPFRDASRDISPRSENRGSDAHDRSPFLDGDLEVLGHPHGEFAQIFAAGRALQRVAQESQAFEGRSAPFGIVRRRWNRHQTDQSQSRPRPTRSEQFERGFRGHTAFLGFAAEVYLDQHFQGVRTIGGAFVQRGAEGRSIDGLHPIESPGDGARLVALKPSDEVPTR
jgi:hypothetical protein